MTATELLAELSGRGVVLEATPEGTIRYKGKLEASDVIKLKAHKKELVNLLLPERPRTTPSPPSPPSPEGRNADKTADPAGDADARAAKQRRPPPQTPSPHAVPRGTDAAADGGDSPRFLARRLEQASELGLVAVWSKHFGHISIHDPTTGEWHDLRREDAPGWAKREAGGGSRRRVVYDDYLPRWGD